MSHPLIYTDETVEALREQVRRFVETEVVPNGDVWEKGGMVPREVLGKMGELGFLGIRYQEKYGGAGLDTVATVAFVEELSRSTYAGFNITVLVHTDMASPHLARFGTSEQLDRYMPDIVAGRKITGVGVTEPGGGSDVQALRTRAEKRGNGWVLNGSKMFITNGVHGDLFFVAARTDPDAKGSRGISMFIVEKDTPGFRVGRKLDKMGWRSSDTAELVFEDCELPGDALLGTENRGFYAIMENFQNERIVLGAMCVGEAQKAIDLTLDYVKERPAFGARLWDKQAIRQRLAMLQAEVAAARQLVYHAAWLDAQGQDATREVSMVKALCGELVNRVMYSCQQFHGGYGYMREFPIERMVRDARIQAIGGGATEVMLEEVAKRM
ncbi:acyl-CoA dehydrogenase [Mesorhizobium sp. J18]|uniref:acyl-CoA dehydrogenase family protein n=1 Tax=Mesorhizobium sp. J18 TaxID=935263 RepID=UPI001199AECF|nr:acyl-CoA dehydrogenase family protein [Mesorhizobium sp. J18]TWG94824.1 acyl-CoA dehydrogenase [Mesorhizobium sp. J18]